jgi:hypothetical protein
MEIVPTQIKNMTNAEFKAWMVANEACQPAQSWVGGRSLKSAWGECRSFHWMAWFALHFATPDVFSAAQRAAYAAGDAYRKSKSNPTQNEFWTKQRAAFRQYFEVV